MQREHIFYLAALIDGEGYIDPGDRIRVSVTSTDIDILERAKEFADDMGNICGPYWNEKSTKPYWEWNITTGREIANLLLAITPLMSNRRREEILKMADILVERSKPSSCLSCESRIETKMRVNTTQYCNSTCRTREWRKRQRERRAA